MIDIDENSLSVFWIFKLPNRAIIAIIRETLFGNVKISFWELPKIKISENYKIVSYSIPFNSLSYKPNKNQYVYYPKYGISSNISLKFSSNNYNWFLDLKNE